MAQWRHIATNIWVNIGSGNGLFPGGTKPLPEPVFTYLISEIHVIAISQTKNNPSH